LLRRNVFCVDQVHASEMRAALNNLNAELVGQASSPASSGGVPPPVGTTEQLAAGKATLPGFPDYVCRVTANEGDIGRGQLKS
jgi:type I restriction enzyme, R subunit